ncbi:MAG: MBL fold metallo-hydrolase [Pseudomonadota bacterium]
MSAAIPFVKTFDFEYGVAARLSPRVRRVIANNPGPFTYTGTGTYIVAAPGADDAPAAVIDPGPYDPAHLEAVARAAGAVSHILITHTHHDHSGGARAFADMTGAPIYAFGAHPTAAAPHLQDHELEEGDDTSFRPDHLLTDGARVDGDGWTLAALHTPGHLANHLCFALDDEKALFTGDHVMGWATTVIVPPAGDMGDYFASLDRLIARDDLIYYPTHGAPIAEPQRFARAVRAHRRIRDGQILAALDDAPSAIPDLVARLYAEVDKRLHGAAAMNVLAHLIRLETIGDVAASDRPFTMRTVFTRTPR